MGDLSAFEITLSNISSTFYRKKVQHSLATSDNCVRQYGDLFPYLVQETLESSKELTGLFDVREMAAVFQDNEG